MGQKKALWAITAEMAWMAGKLVLAKRGRGVILRDGWGDGAEVGLQEGGVVGCCYGCWVGELGGGEEGSFHGIYYTLLEMPCKMRSLTG